MLSDEGNSLLGDTSAQRSGAGEPGLGGRSGEAAKCLQPVSFGLESSVGHKVRLLIYPRVSGASLMLEETDRSDSWIPGRPSVIVSFISPPPARVRAPGEPGSLPAGQAHWEAPGTQPALMPALLAFLLPLDRKSASDRPRDCNSLPLASVPHLQNQRPLPAHTPLSLILGE